MKRLLVIGLSILLLLTGYTWARGSIRLDASGEGLDYGPLPNEWDDQGVTIMAWAYIVNNPTHDSAIVAIRGAGILYTRADSRELGIYTGEGIGYRAGTFIPQGEWHHFALVRVGLDPCTWTAYYDGVPDVFDQTTDPPGDPHPYFGNDQYFDWFDGRIAAGKIWTAPLSQAEIQAEMGSFAPVRTANIWSVIPMHSHTDLTDQSGLGHTPTVMGVLSTEPDPPLTTPTSLSGRVTYANNVTPGKNVTMTLTAPSFVTRVATTDANGNYAFPALPPGNNYTLTPSKVGDLSGLESLDASDTARFVAGTSVPSVNQRIAADADGDGLLTSFDASLIARFVAGLPETGIVGTWKFVPSSRSYTALSGDLTNQNFVAILVGDAGGNWIPSLPAGDANSHSASPDFSTGQAKSPGRPAPQAGINSVAMGTVFFPLVREFVGLGA